MVASSPTSEWTAPTAERPVRGVVAVPGSKSATNRALVIAALAEGPSTIRGALDSRDSRLMAAALEALGARVESAGGELRVTPAPRGGRGEASVDCGLAGTVMRFVPPLAALGVGPVHFFGDEQATARPMGPVLEALRALGATVTGEALPFSVAGPARGGRVTIDASASSQFVSGLLLAGAALPDGVEVEHAGGTLPSAPHIAMTVDMLRAAGVDVAASKERWQVAPGPVAARDWVVEPDLTSAAVFLAAAAATGGAVTISGWPAATTQPGALAVGILERMGARATLTPRGLALAGPERLRPIDVDLGDVGELVPTVAALAALTDGTSTITGVAHLRGHETDRLAALAAEITALGGSCEELPDGLRIAGRPLSGGPWRCYADHRMATAGAIIGLAVPGVRLDDVACTSKTLPDFPERWGALVAGGARG